MDWDPKIPPMPEGMEPNRSVDLHHCSGSRLDSLLPIDPETGAVATHAFYTYLRATMDLTGRHGQPLALLCIALDDTPLMRFLGPEGLGLIGRAIVRCIRQETRIHDVVGRIEDSPDSHCPAFLVVCPLMDEVSVAPVARRLQEIMSTYCEPTNPLLSMSVGIAMMTLDASEPETLIARAISALRRARRSGGNCVWSHSDVVRQIISQENSEASDESA